MRKMTKVHHWKSEFEGEKPEELAISRQLTMRENGACPNPNGTESFESERIKGQHSTTSQKTTEKSRRLEDTTFSSNETREEPSGHGRKSPLLSTREQWRT